MGVDQTPNGESPFFQSVNREALDFVGCNWRCLDYLPDNSKLITHYQWLRRKITKRLKEDLVAEYWGRHALPFLLGRQTPWGWKDPRTSLLLPVWRDLFPTAAVVHIVRDGRDAALSLITRELKRESVPGVFSEQEMARRYISDMRLWESYVHRIRECLPLFQKHATLQYERLLSSPMEEMEKLVGLLELRPGDPVREIVAIVDPSRTNRHSTGQFSWARGIVDDMPLLREMGYT